MTDQQDPVETWLSADIELLAPPPGAFEYIRRRARRRRAIRAAGAAGGAAMVIAAAVVAPQVAGNLLPRGGGPNSLSGGSTAATSQGTKPAGPSPRGSAVRSQGRGPALTSAGRGATPPAGFMPTSVTFVNSSLGAVIGQARCAAGPCTAVAGTPDYGTTWTRIGAPPAGPADGSTGVSQIRFNTDALDGWAYGPGLYATHTGGKSWHRITLPGRVVDLSTVGGMAFAVVADCSGAGAQYAGGCVSFALYQSTAGSNRWHRVPGASARAPAGPGDLQLTRQGGYLLAGRMLFAGPVTGGRWHRVSNTSSSVPACLSNPAAVPGPALIAPSGGRLYLACDAAPARGSPGPGQPTLYYSTDGGRTWRRGGPISVRGTATSLAAIPGGAVVLATTSGIDYTTDLAHWHRARLDGRVPPGGFSFVGLTTTSEGVAVPASSASGVLFTTRHGGTTWARSAIVRR